MGTVNNYNYYVFQMSESLSIYKSHILKKFIRKRGAIIVAVVFSLSDSDVIGDRQEVAGEGGVASSTLLSQLVQRVAEQQRQLQQMREEHRK